MLLYSERSKCWTFERSLHIIKIVFKTFIPYIFDVLIILTICIHIQQNYLSSFNKLRKYFWNIDIARAAREFQEYPAATWKFY